jgi:hypothetical protein
MTQNPQRFICGYSQKDFSVEPGEVDDKGWWTCPLCGSAMRVTIQRQHMARRIWVPKHSWLALDEALAG